MKRATGSCGAATKAKAGPARVSLRSIYLDAMREVMADPRKAVAEYDPFLAALVPRDRRAAKG